MNEDLLRIRNLGGQSWINPYIETPKEKICLIIDQNYEAVSVLGQKTLGLASLDIEKQDKDEFIKIAKDINKSLVLSYQTIELIGDALDKRKDKDEETYMKCQKSKGKINDYKGVLNTTIDTYYKIYPVPSDTHITAYGAVAGVVGGIMLYLDMKGVPVAEKEWLFLGGVCALCGILDRKTIKKLFVATGNRMSLSSLQARSEQKQPDRASCLKAQVAPFCLP